MSSLVETLYYQIYNSFLLNDNDSAKMYLSFLREEYKEDESKFSCLKNDHRWEHLQNLGNAIDNELTLQNKIDLDKKEENNNVHTESFKNQNELVKSIVLSQNLLKNILKAENDFHCSCVELETNFGRIDLVAQDSMSIYPIEVKTNGAFHDVIGQINKYIIYFKLHLMQKIYQHVRGVVIANNFNEHVIQELRKLNVVILKYVIRDKREVEFIVL